MRTFIQKEGTAFFLSLYNDNSFSYGSCCSTVLYVWGIKFKVDEWRLDRNGGKHNVKVVIETLSAVGSTDTIIEKGK
jgi:hypothetical protein